MKLNDVRNKTIIGLKWKLAKNNKQTQTKVRNKTIIGLKCITIQTADTTFPC